MDEGRNGIEARRFVDCHVHFWDTSFGWYYLPSAEDDYSNLGLEGRSLPNQFVLEDYETAARSVRLDGLVHVTAVADVKDVISETSWIQGLSERSGIPIAIIGTADIQRPRRETAGLLDSCCASPLFRGVRLLGDFDISSDEMRTLLTELARRDLLYELKAHPGPSMAAAARVAASMPEVPFILNHTGWPLQVGSGQDFTEWKESIKLFSSIPNSSCKLSGLGFIFHANDLEKFRPYFDFCVQSFGPDRCMFGTDFPIDQLYSDYETLFDIFEKISQYWSEDTRDKLFRTNAQRIYRI